MKSMLRGMANYLENVEGRILGKAKLDFLMLNVPPVCNYRCKKCFTNAYDRKPENSLSLEKLCSLVDEAKKMGARVVCILGEGEPLVDKNLFKVVEYVNSKDMIPLVTTNGSLLTEENLELLHNANSSIVISLDTLNPNEYKEFCGKSTDLNEVLNNIDRARKKYKDKIVYHDDIKEMAFAIHTTVTASNLNQVPQIREFCGEDIFFSVEHIAKVGEATSNPETYGKDNEYKKCKELCLSIMDPMVMCKTPKGQPACCLFYYGVAVGYEGEIMLDTHAVETRNKIGNVNEETLEQLVERAKQLKEVYFDDFKGCYCLIRDDRYQDFLKEFKNI